MTKFMLPLLPARHFFHLAVPFNRQSHFLRVTYIRTRAANRLDGTTAVRKKASAATDAPKANAAGKVLSLSRRVTSPLCDVNTETSGLCAEIQDVHISAEAHIVSEIPAHMVRIVVNHDLIRAPVPIAAIVSVGERNRPVPAIEPELSGTSAGNPPYVRGTKAASKVPVSPGMVQMVARIVGAGIMPDPVTPVHVGTLGVARFIGIVTVQSLSFQAAS